MSNSAPESERSDAGKMDSRDTGIFVPIDAEISSSIESKSTLNRKTSSSIENKSTLNRKISTKISGASSTSLPAIPSPKRRMQISQTRPDAENAPASPSAAESPIRRQITSVQRTPEKVYMPPAQRSPPIRVATPENGSRSVENSPLAVGGHANASTRRWRRDFIKYKRSETYLRNAPQDYARSTSRSKGDYTLLKISEKDGRPGHGKCRDATVIQWATIIKQAKATHLLTSEFKRAFFTYAEISDDHNEELNIDQKHERKLDHIGDATSCDDKLPMNGVPLSDRARKIQEHLKRRAVGRRQAKQDTLGSPSTRGSPGRTLPSSLNHVITAKGGAGIPWSRNIFLSALSAEENANDYEFRKGEGRVQINQLHQPEVPIPNEPYRLSPSSYAYKDLNFQVSEMFMDGQHTKTTQTVIVTLIMNGKTDQSFKIVVGDELRLSIPFKNIKSFIYGNKAQLLIRYFTSSLSMNENHTENLVDVLLHMEGMAHGSWAILKQCCYKIVQNREPKQRCDQEINEEFFTNKQEDIMRKSLHQFQFPQVANRSAFKLKPHSNPPQKKPSTAVQSTIAFQPMITSKVSNVPDQSKLQKALDISSQSKFQEALVDAEHTEVSSRSELTTKILGRPSSIKNVHFEEPRSESRVKKARVETEEKSIQSSGSTVNRLYYQTKSDTDICVRVAINDMVVRLRSDEEKKNGKRDKFDIFDGPWRITEFKSPASTYGVSHEIEDESAPTRANYKTSEWKKMLTTKVKLNFPEKSCADPWAEIGKLCPVFAETNIRGDIHPSSLIVADLPEFKALVGNTDLESNEDIVDFVMVVEPKAGIRVAVSEVARQKILENDIYEVEKLRDKRVRLYKLSSPAIKKYQLKQDNNDSWVKRLKFHHQEITLGHLLVTEYRVHWTGWPDEDDTWSTGFGNIPQEFIDDFNQHTDCYRGLGTEVSIRKEDLVCQEDLVGLKKRKSNAKGPAPKRRPSGKKNAPVKKYVNSEAKESKDEDIKDTTHYESSEDECSADEETAKAVQASIDDESQRMKSMILQNLTSFQQEIGVPAKKIAQLTGGGEDDEEEEGEESMEIDEEEENQDMEIDEAAAAYCEEECQDINED